MTGIDFDLLAFDEWIWFSVLAERAASPAPTPYKSLRVHLDKWDGTDWVEVDTGVTDVDGFVDLYGYAPGPATEDFRIRFTKSGVTQKIVSYDDYVGPPFPVWEGVRPCGCRIWWWLPAAGAARTPSRTWICCSRPHRPAAALAVQALRDQAAVRTRWRPPRPDPDTHAHSVDPDIQSHPVVEPVGRAERITHAAAR